DRDPLSRIDREGKIIEGANAAAVFFGLGRVQTADFLELDHPYSPFKMIAGCTRRSSDMGTIAERNATATLPASTTGNTLKRGTTGALKFARPIQAAMPMPMINPKAAPTAP